MPFDLDEKFIIAAEERLGARLPASYRRKMMENNGGAVLIKGSDTDEDGCWWLHSILDTSDRKRLKRTCNDIVHETRIRESYDHPAWPKGAVEIGHNGGGDAFLFLRNGEQFAPGIFFWDHEDGTLEQIANDFSDLKIE